jgi:hypothetical protein
MPNIYVRSTDGSDSDNGSTWALAKATLTGAAAIDAAGDTIYISQSHSESTAAAVTFTIAGTAASPVKILCANDGAEPPTALATTGVIATTGASHVSFSGPNYYVYGLTFNCADGTSGTTWPAGNSTGRYTVFENCNINIVGTATASRINFGTNPGYCEFNNVNVKFAAAAQAITGNGVFVWNKGGIASGGTSPTTLFAALSGQSTAYLSGLDLSQGGSSMNIFTAGSNCSKGVIRNSKLPASWTGALASGTLAPGERYELYNCDSTDTNYRLHITDYIGVVSQETTIVRTGGASDGTTTISHKFVSGANAEYPHLTLSGPEIVRWNETTGSAITATVEIITDNVTLTDEQCWLEVQYLGTSGFPISSIVSDAKADFLATAANQTTSSETWTTTGLTTPVKQKLSVSFTPQEKGYIHAVVKLARASTTVYVDPKITVA